LQTAYDLNFALLNIRTMLDRDRADRPERRSGIIVQELKKYRIDVEALSEACFGDTGSAKISEMKSESMLSSPI
jgi:hypothetical protein